MALPLFPKRYGGRPVREVGGVVVGRVDSGSLGGPRDPKDSLDRFEGLL